LDLDDSAAILPYPAVVYRWLPGEPLIGKRSGGKLPGRKLAALLEIVQLVHWIAAPEGENQEKAGLPEAWFHWFERRTYLDELNGFLEQYRSWLCEDIAKGKAICARLERIVTACTREVNDSPAKINRGSVPLRLCHVDPNPANLIWGSDGRLRWVDWEYSGWGDPALDLADFRWHQALSFIGPKQAAWMRAHYQPPPGDDGFYQRLRLWDALLAARWPFLVLRWLWSIYNGPDRERLSMPQAQAAEVRLQMERLIERAERFYEINY
jgi:aminoglycoside phosphotransferase (APT) family kinase protein